MGRGLSSLQQQDQAAEGWLCKRWIAVSQACVLSMVSRRLVLTTCIYLRVVSFFLWPKTFCKSAMDMPLFTLCALNVCRSVCTPDFLTPAFL